jgi:hypothetical protein
MPEVEIPVPDIEHFVEHELDTDFDMYCKSRPQCIPRQLSKPLNRDSIETHSNSQYRPVSPPEQVAKMATFIGEPNVIYDTEGRNMPTVNHLFAKFINLYQLHNQQEEVAKFMSEIPKLVLPNQSPEIELYKPVILVSTSMWPEPKDRPNYPTNMVIPPHPPRPPDESNISPMVKIVKNSPDMFLNSIHCNSMTIHYLVVNIFLVIGMICLYSPLIGLLQKNCFSV